MLICMNCDKYIYCYSYPICYIIQICIKFSVSQIHWSLFIFRRFLHYHSKMVKSVVNIVIAKGWWRLDLTNPVSSNAILLFEKSHETFVTAARKTTKVSIVMCCMWWKHDATMWIFHIKVSAHNSTTILIETSTPKWNNEAVKCLRLVNQLGYMCIRSIYKPMNIHLMSSFLCLSWLFRNSQMLKHTLFAK